MSVILSPHLDDAVLSLGQFIQTEPCTVVTVFAGAPTEGLSDYDRSCGFTSSVDAMAARRAEDIAALAALGCTTSSHLTFLDQQYGTPTSDDDLAAAIAPHLDRGAVVPLGLGHPDHAQVFRCCMLAARPGVPLCFYEELPYRVLWPEQAHAARKLLLLNGFQIQELPFPILQGDRDVKAKAIACYASQFPSGADDPCLLVPERMWRAVKVAA